jgi:hypothetical protein
MTEVLQAMIASVTEGCMVAGLLVAQISDVTAGAARAADVGTDRHPKPFTIPSALPFAVALFKFGCLSRAQRKTRMLSVPNWHQVEIA